MATISQLSLNGTSHSLGSFSGLSATPIWQLIGSGSQDNKRWNVSSSSSSITLTQVIVEEASGSEYDWEQYRGGFTISW